MSLSPEGKRRSLPSRVRGVRRRSARPTPRFFATSAAFRSWLAANHGARTELLVGFRKVASRRRLFTWDEAVDEALCFGWVDGVRHRLDDASYTVRFTPRRAGSTWSAVNIARIARLEREGRMAEAGRAAFAARTERRSRAYSYERKVAAALASDLAAALRADAAAWTFHCAQAPSYQRKVVHWIMAAAAEETRLRRLRQLLERDEHDVRQVDAAREPRWRRGILTAHDDRQLCLARDVRGREAVVVTGSQRDHRTGLRGGESRPQLGRVRDAHGRLRAHRRGEREQCCDTWFHPGRDHRRPRP
jgi:uncharacterized protein YdeI (YjbR/CyaY-like superfamily)